jgi:hypothetical protein
MAHRVHLFTGNGNLGPRGGKLLIFHCPGCKYGHPFEIECPKGDGWTWNGSYDKPTFQPSLLISKDYPAQRCHSFVKDGKIQFLGDCFHELKNQTVDLPDWDD